MAANQKERSEVPLKGRLTSLSTSEALFVLRRGFARVFVVFHSVMGSIQPGEPHNDNPEEKRYWLPIETNLV